MRLFLNGPATEGCHPGGNRRRKVLPLALTVASSLLVSAAFPPCDVGIVAWVALAPFLYAIRQVGYPAAALLGLLFGVLHLGGTLLWSLDIATITLYDFFLCVLLLSLYFLLFGGFARLISGKAGTWSIVGIPSLWVALEYARSNMYFLAFPWNLLGHSQHLHLMVAQIADVTGVYGISFAVVAANEFLSRLPGLLPSRTRGVAPADGWSSKAQWAFPAATVCALLVFMLLYGWRTLSAPVGDRRVRVAVVQANIVVRDNMSFAEQVDHYRVYERMTRDAAERKPDLIVWPSSSIPAPFTDRLARYTLVRLARAADTYLLVGGAGHRKDRPRREGDPVFSNSEFLFSPSGRLEGQFNKIRLLPFNEYLPLRGTVPWPAWIAGVKEDFLPGTEYTVFRLPMAAFSTPICWENLFPDTFGRFVRDGAQFMVPVTNETFFGGKGPTPYRQSLAMYVFRAIENRVAIARAASTGISAFVLPTGEVADRVQDGSGKDWDIAGILTRDLPLAERKTFYTVHGDLFAWIAITVAAMIVLVSAFMKVRGRSGGGTNGEP